MKKLRSCLILSVLLASIGAQAAPLTSGVDATGTDPTVRVQDDVFLAINGGWIKNTPIPADESRIGAFLNVYNQTQDQIRTIVEGLDDKSTGEALLVRSMYRSFMDTEHTNVLGLKPLAPQFREVDAVKDVPSLMRLIGRWQGQGISLPLELGVEPDSKAPTRYLAVASQSGLAMPDRDYYLESDARFAKAREAYLGYLKDSFIALGLNQPAQRAQRVLDLETAIARIQWDKVINRDPVKTYNRFTLQDLAKKVPAVDWNAFLQAGTTQKLSALDVSQPTYATALGKLIKATPVATWQDYLRIHVLSAYSPCLDDKTVERHFAFFNGTLHGMTENRPRWKRGLRLIDSTVGEALGKIYVDKYFPPANKARMLELVHNLIEAYDQDLDTLTWLKDKKSLAAAHQKLAKLMIKIGYPDKWRGYEGLVVDEKDLLGNVQRAAAFEYRRQFAEINETVDRTRWWMKPQTVNAYYNPTMNEIVFPAAILQPPFFDMQADDAVNYGGIGAVIGHEISHGFDDQGSQFDADGKLETWMDKADSDRFKEITHRLVEQYNHYEALPGKFVNGELTMGENIADNAGLAIAYKAYRLSLAGKEAPVMDGFTGDQRFFIGFAQVWRGKDRPEALLNQITSDPHSPSRFRAIGATVNSDAFENAFGVKPGDGMYKAPEERIRIW